MCPDNFNSPPSFEQLPAPMIKDKDLLKNLWRTPTMSAYSYLMQAYLWTQQ